MMAPGKTCVQRIFTSGSILKMTINRKVSITNTKPVLTLSSKATGMNGSLPIINLPKPSSSAFSTRETSSKNPSPMIMVKESARVIRSLIKPFLALARTPQIILRESCISAKIPVAPIVSTIILMAVANPLFFWKLILDITSCIWNAVLGPIYCCNSENKRPSSAFWP
ncbi:hypothetical protein D3C86_1475580 [compost metagenome]